MKIKRKKISQGNRQINKITRTNKENIFMAMSHNLAIT